MLVQVSIPGVIDDLDVLLWAMSRLADPETRLAVPIAADDAYSAAWTEYCGAIERLSVRLNSGAIPGLDCSNAVRWKLQTLWEWLQRCACERPDLYSDDWRKFVAASSVWHAAGQQMLIGLRGRGAVAIYSINEARDEWMHQKRLGGLTNNEILTELRRDHQEWDAPENEQSVSKAIKRYCQRHNIQVISRKRSNDEPR
ncbi:hypothetical protein [Lacipirellula sp.]|uniref:hypothetical protein n=1 Tax=Lacipirellula sp. TaxID=2691419 RepID=UPI003D0F77BA